MVGEINDLLLLLVHVECVLKNMGGVLSVTRDKGGGIILPVVSRYSTLLLSATADLRSADDVVAFKGDWFYSLKMHPAPPYGEVNEIISFLAFCPDSTCSNTTCKISRAAIPDSTITPLKYDRCFPTNAKEKFSYFVRQGRSKIPLSNQESARGH